MYFIVHGEVEVVDEHDSVLARLHDGDFFGEMALLTDNPRNATARTASFCDLYVLGRESFKQVAVRHPCSTRQSTRKRVTASRPPRCPLCLIGYASCRARSSASVWRRRVASTRASRAKILMPTRGWARTTSSKRSREMT